MVIFQYQSAMRKQLLVLAIALLLVLPMVSARIQYFQEKGDLGNKTIRNHIALCYDKEALSLGSSILDDYVSGGNLFESYISYNIYVKKWNNDNPLNQISSCNFFIRQDSGSNFRTLINQTYNSSDIDIFSSKFFFKMADSDCIRSQITCTYSGTQSELDIPAEQQLIAPTWECKACQMYEWAKVEVDIEKGKLINANVVELSLFIKNLLILNFEVILGLFWIFLIAMFLTLIGLILTGIYWAYLILKGWIK